MKDIGHATPVTSTERDGQRTEWKRIKDKETLKKKDRDERASQKIPQGGSRESSGRTKDPVTFLVSKNQRN